AADLQRWRAKRFAGSAAAHARRDGRTEWGGAVVEFPRYAPAESHLRERVRDRLSQLRADFSKPLRRTQLGARRRPHAEVPGGRTVASTQPKRKFNVGVWNGA